MEEKRNNREAQEKRRLEERRVGERIEGRTALSGESMAMEADVNDVAVWDVRSG